MTQKTKRAAAPFAPFETEWGSFAPLKLRAKTVAEGLYAGVHRSVRKGSGIEFGGQRPYVPGDDLRFIDRRALLKHDRFMVREFETETDRALWLVVDASASMAFKGSGPGSKLPFAAVLAASLARVAIAAGDPVGLVILAGDKPIALRASAGREAFDRIVFALSDVKASGDLTASDEELEARLVPVHERARRGATMLLFSDLIDLPESGLAAFTALATRGRRAFAVQVLTPEEEHLKVKGHSRFKSLEGGFVVEADPDAVRAEYLRRLAQHRARWHDDLVGRGGALLHFETTTAPIDAVRSVLLTIAGQPLSRAAEGALGA
ncbi:MAG: DUF58 domain-containing protein [Polyangiaceae bacterium]